MLKGISPLLSPELLKALNEMGHGDTLVIADGNFPAESVGKNAKVIRADGHGVPELLDAVLALLKDKLSAFAPGSPLDERTLMGPLANRQQYDKVLRLIQTARDEGDTIVCGGEALPGEGYFLQPTAVKVRSEESTLMREETFGPVCSFIGYRSEEEALARMNASPYGLAASVWSDNIRQALRYSEAIEAGIVWVNMHTFLDPAVPFGGMKGSGIGREFGSAFIDDYTELKSVMVRY